MTQYCYSVDGEFFTGRFETPEEAATACISEHNLGVGEIYKIAEVREYETREFIGVLDIMTKMNEQAVHEVGKEQVGLWPDVSPSKYHELRELLVDFFNRNYPVNFWKEKNIKDYIVMDNSVKQEDI